MQIRKLGKYVFDVFCGVGYDDWSRIRKFHWGYKVVYGNRMPKEKLNEVVSALIDYPYGSIDNV